MIDAHALVPCCNPASVTGYGNPHADVMFVGIAPGRDEWERTKRPLTGPSGRLLDAVLNAIGLKRDDVYCTNLICHWKDAPTPDDIKACATRLQQEINLVNPTWLVALGKIPYEALFHLSTPFSRARGAVIRLSPTRRGLVTNHPAAALHKDNPDMQINAAYDIVRDLKKLLGSYPSELYDPISFSVVSTVEEAQLTLDSLPTDTPVALDIETTYDKESDSAHPFSDTITCIGMSYLDQDNVEQTRVLALPCITTELKWPRDVSWLFHNGVFDTQQIAKHLGVWLPISNDTMLQSYAVDERSQRGLHKLKSLAREFCGAGFYEEESHTLDGTKEQEAILHEYNAKDCVYTLRLHSHLKQMQREDDVLHHYQQLLLPAQEMLARAQYRGIYVDPTAIRDIEITFGVEYLKAHVQLKKMAKGLINEEINPNSPTQVKLLLAAQGINITNTRKATLQELLDTTDNPFVTHLLRYRMLHKLVTSYLNRIPAFIKYDGRVHPHAFLTGTVTGRLSYKDPAIQTLPKPKTVGELGIIRKIFSCTNDDYVLLEADYAAIEAWLGAYFSQDPVLLSDLQSGDWHTQTTLDVFKVNPSTTTKDQWAFYRDAGKHLNYGNMYGEGPEGLTRRPPIGMGCDIQTAREYHRRWYQRYHVYAEYQLKCKYLAKYKGELVTPFGRKRRFPLMVNQHQEGQALNAQIQSTAGDYTLSSAIRLHHALTQLDTHLLFLEHDALYYEVSKRHLEEVINLIKYEMQRPPLPNLPSINIEMDIGPNLAELTRVEI